jgi:hypothetical protein
VAHPQRRQWHTPRGDSGTPPEATVAHAQRRQWHTPRGDSGTPQQGLAGEAILPEATVTRSVYRDWLESTLPEATAAHNVDSGTQR